MNSKMNFSYDDTSFLPELDERPTRKLLEAPHQSLKLQIKLLRKSQNNISVVEKSLFFLLKDNKCNIYIQTSAFLSSSPTMLKSTQAKQVNEFCLLFQELVRAKCVRPATILGN